jgi:hypothetical protein
MYFGLTDSLFDKKKIVAWVFLDKHKIIIKKT